MSKHYGIKRTSLVTWEIIDKKTMKVLYKNLSLYKADKIVEELENKLKEE